MFISQARLPRFFRKIPFSFWQTRQHRLRLKVPSSKTGKFGLGNHSGNRTPRFLRRNSTVWELTLYSEESFSTINFRSLIFFLKRASRDLYRNFLGRRSSAANPFASISSSSIARPETESLNLTVGVSTYILPSCSRKCPISWAIVNLCRWI